ncbi:MAG: pectinesterase family protein [Syntrophothermus sp.]
MIKSKLKIKNSKLFSFIVVLLSFTSTHASEKFDAVVAKDGSGTFRTVQEAINAAPENTAKPFVIFIKNGVYNEKVFIEKNNITLIGENRDSTRIIYAELRASWLKDYPGNDWGAAVLNIGNKASDLTFANLTVYNNYGSLHDTTNHQFAVRGGGTRVIFLNCNLKADGGDTVSPWNTLDGMYYFSDCYFEGWVDYVCPRGWCFIENSRFFGHNLTASIWHDGSHDKDQKFVIRKSFFDGVKNFPLGRNHRDGQFFLIDCRFSENMLDKPIYQCSPAENYKWPSRYYYFNCSREGGNFSWFANNLDKAAPKITADKITPEWTFAGRWNPMPAVKNIKQKYKI